MKNIICVILFIYLYAINSFAGISSVTIDNNNFTISGSGFGTKAIAPPIKWDTFEDGTVGTTVDSTGYWIKRNELAVFNDDTSRCQGSPKNIKVTHEPLTSSWFYKNNIGFSITGKCYVNFWARIDAVSGDDSWQHKFWRLNSTGEHPSAPAVINQLWFDTMYPTQASQDYYEIRDASGTNISTSYKTYKIQESTWVNMTVQWKASDIDQYNGSVMMTSSYQGGIQKIVLNNIRTKLTGYTLDLDALNLGYLIESGGTLVYTYFDDVYMDNSWSRVEIGDNSTYDNCTHREIQPAITWSDTGITGTFNKGSFETGDTVYVFVIDENGIPSDGYTVVIGSEPVVADPVVEILTTSGQTTTASVFTITGTATADTGQTISGVTCSGQTVSPDDGTWDEQTEAFTCLANLALGENTLVFVGSDGTRTGSDSIVITYKKKLAINGNGAINNAILH